MTLLEGSHMASPPASSRWRSVALIAGVAFVAGAGGAWLASKPFAPDRAPAPAAAAPAAPAAEPHVPPPHPTFPRMQLQAQYAGPLQDTIIQRWRDPVDGTICYLYLPIAVHHTPLSNETGYVEYGSSAVGSISCYGPPQGVARPAPTPRAAPAQ
jgi:hypothetical protein